MDNKVMVSINITTYNHGKYVKEAIDSVLNQLTNYTYEILVGDDNSSDQTTNILKEYENKFPDRIRVFYRSTNMGGGGVNNMMDLVYKCSGKYIITLEGDDFWLDKCKLEKQISFLEQNPSYIGVSHSCIVVGEDSKPNGEDYPECRQNIYSLKHFASNILPGQLTTVLYRNIYKDNKIDKSLLDYKLMPADRFIYFILSSYGDIYCIQEKMSAYRHIIKGGSSFSANFSWDYSFFRKWNGVLVKYSRKIGNPESVKYSELMLMKVIIGSRKRCGNSWKIIIRDLQQEKVPIIRYIQYLKQLYNRRVLQLEIWA